MATMDSDSESQDSDDGRRFRFETTRKDASVISRSRNRDSTYSSRSEQQSRSPGRLDRNRKDHNRDSRSRYDSRDSKDRRDRHSYQKYLKDSKDAHDSKHLKNRNESKGSPSQRERDSKDSKDRRDSKSSRAHDKDSKIVKESRSSKDRTRKRSRDRSHSDRSSSDRHKLKSHEKQKISTKCKEGETCEKSEKDAKVSLEIEQTKNELPKEVLGSIQDGFHEFNISDFEIVSDLEEFSTDSPNSSPGHTLKVRKRHSKSDGHSERKRLQTDDLRKVNPRNGNHSTISSNNNPTPLSDLSLDSATKSDGKKQKNDEKSVMEVKIETDALQDSELKSEEKSCIYGPILPPILAKSPNPRFDESSDAETENRVLLLKDTKEKKLIGPQLPSSSSKSVDLMESDLSSTEVEVNLRQRNCDTKNKVEIESRKIDDEKSSKETNQARIIGPSLPPHLVSQNKESDDDDDDDDVYGPILPPNLVKKVKNDSGLRVIGPSLPSEIKSDESEEDEEVIGPLPADDPANRTSIVQQSLEFRARRIQNEFMTEPENKNNKREEWMTHLPPVKAASIGLGPRKFKTRDGPDLSDRSSWTDTPSDKIRKRQEKAEERLAAIATEKETIKSLSSSKKDTSEKSKRREKSLLEVHQKKLKKKKKKEEKEAREKGKSTRRPFDRDVDLEANRFDEAQKKHIFMKAQLLDDRFTRGKM